MKEKIWKPFKEGFVDAWRLGWLLLTTPFTATAGVLRSFVNHTGPFDHSRDQRKQQPAH